MTEPKSDATTLPAADLLRSAARLIERALIQLDMTYTECGECEHKHYNNRDHYFAYQGLTDTPTKLNRLADQLAGDPVARAERERRRQQDLALKGRKTGGNQ